MRLTVEDLMTQKPVMAAPTCSADKAVEILSRHDATELYVVDKSGRLLGVVPDFELLKAELSGEAADATVETLMSRNIPVFTPASDAAEVARLFRDGRYRQFPVVDRGRLVGTVTRGDIVRLMAILRRIDCPVPRAIEKHKAPKLVTARAQRSRTTTSPVARTKRSRRPTARLSSR